MGATDNKEGNESKVKFIFDKIKDIEEAVIIEEPFNYTPPVDIRPEKLVIREFYETLNVNPDKDHLSEFKKDMAGVHAARMNCLLTTMDDKAFVSTYLALSEYAMPKLQRIQHDDKGVKEDFTLNVKVISNKKDLKNEKGLD